MKWKTQDGSVTINTDGEEVTYIKESMWKKLLNFLLRKKKQKYVSVYDLEEAILRTEIRILKELQREYFKENPLLKHMKEKNYGTTRRDQIA